MENSQPIKVLVRIRPVQKSENIIFWEVDDDFTSINTINHNMAQPEEVGKLNKKLIIDSIFTPQHFSFDRVYTPKETSEDIYQEHGKDILKAVLKGISSTIFMYGQTNSGKTYTMLGEENSPGLIICFLNQIFEELEATTSKFKVYCSYVEIYNENLKDLLTGRDNLTLVNDSENGVYLKGLRKVNIRCFDDGLVMLAKGDKERKACSNRVNDLSSRSHTIFQIVVL